MPAFDPAAATAAYLAGVAPQAHARAIAYTQGGHWLLLWGWLVALAAAWLIVWSRLLVRAQGRIERDRGRPVLASLAVAALYFALDFVLELPWTGYAGWWRERQYGQTSQAFADWLGEQVMSLVLSLVLGALFVAALYAMIRTARRNWWVWAGGLTALGVAVMLVIGPAFIEPMFNTYTPAPPGPMRDAVVALAAKAGVPSDKTFIYDGSRQSNRYTANVSGLGGSARVAMSDVMFAKGADVAEVRAVVGHEMGHYSRSHVLWLTAIYSLLAVAMLWIADRVFPLAARLLGSSAAGIADPAGLPVLMAIVATLALVATPVLNTLTRVIESDADAFSLRVANEPDGLARAMVKTLDYRAPSPSALEETLFYDHPSVERRVRRAMDWKAAHGAGVGG